MIIIWENFLGTTEYEARESNNCQCRDEWNNLSNNLWYSRWYLKKVGEKANSGKKRLKLGKNTRSLAEKRRDLHKKYLRDGSDENKKNVRKVEKVSKCEL